MNTRIRTDKEILDYLDRRMQSVASEFLAGGFPTIWTEFDVRTAISIKMENEEKKQTQTS